MATRDQMKESSLSGRMDIVLGMGGSCRRTINSETLTEIQKISEGKGKIDGRPTEELETLRDQLDKFDELCVTIRGREGSDMQNGARHVARTISTVLQSRAKAIEDAEKAKEAKEAQKSATEAA